jgi:hypothetical protein
MTPKATTDFFKLSPVTSNIWLFRPLLKPYSTKTRVKTVSKTGSAQHAKAGVAYVLIRRFLNVPGLYE